MTKKLLMIIALAVIFIAGSAAAELSKTMPKVEYPLIRGDEVLNIDEYIPYDPGVITDSPGAIVGYSFYDYQTNGSSGNRVAICDDGSIYFSWMKLFGWPYPPAPRHVFYNWIDTEGNWFSPEEGGQVSENAGSGYTTLDVIYGNRGAVAYHVFTDEPHVFTSIEWDPPGMGFFDHYEAPHDIFPQTPESPGEMYWPYVAIDGNNRIHIAFTENTDRRMQRLGYTRSDDGGATWTTIAQVDTVMVISSVIDASPVSDRVVFAYAETQDTSTQWNNDIVYYISENGTTWDWRYGKTNVTNYGTDSDSLWSYTDLDVIIDYDDYVHLIWNAQWVTDEGIYYRTFLFHYSEATDQINTIAIHPDSLWTSISGAWNRPMCKMNLGVYPLDGQSDGIFATWTQFDTSDVSAGGFGNGELYMTYTIDNGANWATPVNITNSATPGCFPGECDSDHWSTLADVVGDSLHVFYTNDKDAGGIPQDEGAATESPMRYLKVQNPLATSIDDNGNNLPERFALNQNYPNPFNAKTSISFDLKFDSPVTLEIFDITGARVATLVDERLAAGSHSVVWDAGDVASGTYFYKLTCGDATETMKAVLIK